MLIPDDCFCQIILYLDKIDLQTLVEAFSNCEKNRYHENIIHGILKNIPYNRLQVCSWTHKYGMKNKKEYVTIEDIKYISNICQDLIIWNEHRNRYNSEIIMQNHNLIKIHIDAYISYVYNITLDCPNLRFLNIINMKRLDTEMLHQIIQKCQKLERIFISYSGKIDSNYLNRMKTEKPELKIIYIE